MDDVQPDEVESQHHREEVGQKNGRDVTCHEQELLAVLEQVVHPGDIS